MRKTNCCFFSPVFLTETGDNLFCEHNKLTNLPPKTSGIIIILVRYCRSANFSHMQFHQFQKAVGCGKSYRSPPCGTLFLWFLLEKLRADILSKTYKSERNRKPHEKVISKFRPNVFFHRHGRDHSNKNCLIIYTVLLDHCRKTVLFLNPWH